MKLERTNSDNIDFLNLVKELDEYLALKDGEEHSYYVQYNKTDSLQHCAVLYDEGVAIGCGALRPYDQDCMEVKRMFIKPEARNRGLASLILTELENWSRELGYTATILETGKRQTEAVHLYAKTYQQIPNYGQYENMENSLCFKKILTN